MSFLNLFKRKPQKEEEQTLTHFEKPFGGSKKISCVLQNNITGLIDITLS